ncbi:lysine transporter LysE [Desulfomarina profundi]|uniref:Lysine transporter LysE n=1 Tax=Desulfomarina profundi TaxID=2772557 RepID=A0A8D5FK04_9BACT|nr:LysE family translocator [Desulfomarina profundi]BCL60353.1 lysine transporter LysE [Desulfomarina profundi]
MSPESALTFFTAIFLFAITPGPGTFALTGRALAFGWRSCRGMAFGMALGDVIYLVFACFGLAIVAERYEEIFMAIRYAGAVYLVYLGLKLWFAPSEDGQSMSHKKTGKKAWAGVLQGFLISSSNPKVILFYIAFLPTFIDLTSLGGRDVLLASLLTIVALMSGLMLVAFCAGSAGKLLRSPSSVKRMNRGAGTIIAGAGIYLAFHD